MSEAIPPTVERELQRAAEQRASDVYFLPSEPVAFRVRGEIVRSDGDVLSARYPNARTHLVTAGRIRVTRHEPRGEPPYLTGSIENIEPRRIHVPRELASALLPRRFDAAPPSLTVSIRYGRNFEPWVVGISMK